MFLRNRIASWHSAANSKWIEIVHSGYDGAMAFRSNQEALRAKNEALEGDLRDARVALHAAEERVRELERLEAAAKGRPDPAGLGIEPSARTPLVMTMLASVAMGLVALTMVSALVEQRRAHRELVRRNIGKSEADAFLERWAEGSRFSQHKAQRHEVAGPPSADSRTAAGTDDGFDHQGRSGSRAGFGIAGGWVEHEGVVVSTKGPAPVLLGSTCRVTLTPRAPARGFPHARRRLRVECGGRHMYGPSIPPEHDAPRGILRGGGELTCRGAYLASERCMDDRGSKSDGDPMALVDLPKGRVTISDGPALFWQVDVAIAPTPHP